MPWASRLLRGDAVWVRVDARGQPIAGADGRVEVRYREGGKVYRAALINLQPAPDAKTLPDNDEVEGSLDPNAVIAYTDGACTGNPGPMGIGVVVIDGAERRELSEFLGPGTNNIAELMAIVRALELCPRDRPVILHSDSAYALGLLGKNWKAKANQAVVERMRALGREFRSLQLVKVAGHAGVVENERCDELARTAILRGA